MSNKVVKIFRHISQENRIASFRDPLIQTKQKRWYIVNAGPDYNIFLLANEFELILGLQSAAKIKTFKIVFWGLVAD